MTDYTIDPGATIDRLIAERDAALAELKTQTLRADAAVGDANEAEQRLTAADERADVLEGQLAESECKRREFVAAVKVETDQIEAKLSRCVVVPEGYAVVPIKPTKSMRDACKIAGKLPVWEAMMAAALKPAEGGGDEN